MLYLLLLCACVALARGACVVQQGAQQVDGACCAAAGGGALAQGLCKSTRACAIAGGVSTPRQPGCEDIPSSSIQCCTGIPLPSNLVEEEPSTPDAPSPPPTPPGDVCAVDPNAEQRHHGACCSDAGARGLCMSEYECEALGKEALSSSHAVGCADLVPSTYKCCVGASAAEVGVAAAPIDGCSEAWPAALGVVPVMHEPMEERLNDAGQTLRRHRQPVNKFVLHTMQVDSWYWCVDVWRRPGKLSAPHFLAGINNETGMCSFYQYYPLDKSARALGYGNTNGAIQVEIQGRAENPFTDNATMTECIRELYYGLQQVCPNIRDRIDPRVTYRPSRQAYGRSQPGRLSVADWKDVSGLVGHQHAPRNSHWDPGPINAPLMLMEHRVYNTLPGAAEAETFSDVVGGWLDDLTFVPRSDPCLLRFTSGPVCDPLTDRTVWCSGGITMYEESCAERGCNEALTGCAAESRKRAVAATLHPSHEAPTPRRKRDTLEESPRQYAQSLCAWSPTDVAHASYCVDDETVVHCEAQHIMSVSTCAERPCVGACNFADLRDAVVNDYMSVRWLCERGITAGCEPGAFCPDAPVTRATFAVWLHRAMRVAQGDAAVVQLDRAAAPTFPDVPRDAWESDAVETLFELAVVTGCDGVGSENFCPERSISRRELAYLLMRPVLLMDLANVLPSPFSDVPTGAQHSDYVVEAASRGILVPCGADTFCPDRAASRMEIALALRVWARVLEREQPITTSWSSSRAPRLSGIADACADLVCSTNSAKQWTCSGANTLTRCAPRNGQMVPLETRHCAAECVGSGSDSVDDSCPEFCPGKADGPYCGSAVAILHCVGGAQADLALCAHGCHSAAEFDPSDATCSSDSAVTFNMALEDTLGATEFATPGNQPFAFRGSSGSGGDGSDSRISGVTIVVIVVAALVCVMCVGLLLLVALVIARRSSGRGGVAPQHSTFVHHGSGRSRSNSAMQSHSRRYAERVSSRYSMRRGRSQANLRRPPMQ